MTKAAEDFEDIARRLKELEADRQLALTGSSAPEPAETLRDIESVYGIEYCGFGQLGPSFGRLSTASAVVSWDDMPDNPAHKSAHEWTAEFEKLYKQVEVTVKSQALWTPFLMGDTVYVKRDDGKVFAVPSGL